MQTSKPISTISYNSELFLKATLDHLLKTNIIDFYCYIPHIGEDDGYGEKEKDHIHLFILPNHRINTADLDLEFIEPDPNNDKPLKCITWQTSKPDDWILYVLHDPDYLATKFETREIQYRFTDLVGSDQEDLRRKYRHAYQSSGYARSRNLFEYAKSGGTLHDLLRIGAIPINQVSSYQDFFKESRKISTSINQSKDQDG